MVSRYRLLGMALVFLALPGFKLSGFGDGHDVARVQSVEPTGQPFTQALTQEYRQIAVFEAKQMVDWADAGHFARKGLRSAAGDVVEPELIEAWDLPEDKVGELTAAREGLIQYYDRNARAKVPELAARAQGRYDCWIEQQEENHQPDHIAACRSGYYAAIEAMKMAMTPQQEATAPPVPEAKAPAAPMKFTIYFDFDSAQVTPSGIETINGIAEAVRKINPAGLSVTGHADRAGPPDYNLTLSIKRAGSVRDLLLAREFASSNVSMAGRGETETAIPTPDGVREQANRRVEIVLIE